MSLTAMERAVNFSRGYLSKVENDRVPPNEALARRCDDALGAGGELVRLVGARPRRTRAASATVNVPVDIPSAPAQFVGREAELDQVERISTSSGPPGLVPIVVVHGMAGIGKTALVLHAAHRMRVRFPDGALFVDFGSYGWSRKGLTAAEALDHLLRRLGVAVEAMPSSLNERAARYRNLLSGRRVLVVLDNVRRADQVTGLIPATAGCCVLITSRGPLRALDDGAPVYLRPLPGADAARLFAAIAGDPGRSTARAEIADIVAACGGLPLALRIAAAQCRSAAEGTLSALAVSLRDRRRGDALNDGERSVQAVFHAAVSELPSARRALLLLLSISPATSVTLESAAWLAGADRSAVSGQLAGLQDDGLVLTDGGRVFLHDLVRALAEHLAGQDVSKSDRVEALRRLVTGYMHTVHAADSVLTPHRFRPALTLPALPVAPVAFADAGTALDWCAAELANVVALCRLAWTLGWDSECWHIAYAMRGYFFLTKSMDAWTTTHRLALGAAQRSGHAWAEAVTRNNLGLSLMGQGKVAAAEAEYRRALIIFKGMDDRYGIAVTLGHQAWSRYVAGRYRAAVTLGRQALTEYYDQPRGQAITMRTIALAEAKLQRYATAVADLEQALGVFEALGLSMDAAMTWNCLGEVYRNQSLTHESLRAHARALTVSRACGSRYEQARARVGLAAAATATGRHRATARLLATAADLYAELGAEAEESALTKEVGLMAAHDSVSG